MKSATNTIIFAAVLGSVCSALLVGASLFTAPYREANEKAERVRNYLGSMGAPVSDDMKAEDLITMYNLCVTNRQRGDAELLEYRANGTGDVLVVGVPFRGPGVWGPIEGVLALKADLQTIVDIRFYKQEETPGLGGEIASPWFREQFAGKKIVSSKGVPGFRVRKKGTANDDNEVDGITGATMTSDKVTDILNPLAKKLQEK